MENDVFEQGLDQVIAWCLSYFSSVGDYPVFSNPEPGAIRRKLQELDFASNSSFETIFREFESIIVPGITHWQHPHFFAYFPASRSKVSFLAEILTSALGLQCMNWVSSPAAAELEEVVCDEVLKAIELPVQFKGVLQDSGSTSNLVAILQAREWKTSFRSNNEGLFDAARLRIYASDQIHSSIDKAVRIAGIGSDNLVKVSTNADLSIDTVLLEHLIKSDITQGFIPCCIIGAYGTTSTTAVDNLDELIRIKKEYNCWLHVDGSFAGCALILPEYRNLINELEQIDSLVLNPHKWFFTNLDCSLYATCHPAELVRTFEASPAYLLTPQDGQVNNYRDWGINLARRFRSLKLFFVLRYYGFDGIGNLIRGHIEQVKLLAKEIHSSQDFEVVTPVNFNLVCFRYKPFGVNDEDLIDCLNQQLVDAINNSGKLLLTPTRVNNRLCIRLVNGKIEHSQQHLDYAWKIIRAIAEELTKKV